MLEAMIKAKQGRLLFNSYRMSLTISQENWKSSQTSSLVLQSWLLCQPHWDSPKLQVFRYGDRD
jgi:hypothetical protein